MGFKKENSIVKKLLAERREKVAQYESYIMDEWLFNCFEQMFNLGKEEGKSELEAKERKLAEAEKVVEAAKGLSHGTDWNLGTHAGIYRSRLIEALSDYKASKG